MKNRIAHRLEDSPESRQAQNEEVQRMDDILDQLLGQYERRFPHLRIAVVETPVTAF
jgi:hypothetical protein